MAWYPTNSAKKLTSPPRIMGSVVDAATSHYFSAFTLLLATWLPVLLLHSPALSVYIALWYTMRCITQTMRSKYEVRCLSASIIIDSSTFRLSSRCHLKYLQLCLHCTLFGSALLCHRHVRTLQLYDRWLVWLDGWANVQPEHPASMAAFSSFPAWYNCECYVVGCCFIVKMNAFVCTAAASISALISVGIGILPMWGGCCCIVKMSAFVTALISIGIGISPIYQLILPHISTTL